MGNKKISELPAALSLENSDLLVVVDVSATTTKKATLSQALDLAVRSVGVSGGTTGLTTSGGPITTIGTITLGGTLAVGHGGTGASNIADARTNLGLGSAAVLNAGVPSGVATLDGAGLVPVTQLPSSVLGGVSYQGTWNAATNTPALSSGSGTKGHYYVVSVAGSTALDGISSWGVGDWAIFNGTAWQKVDNTDLVSSVNGQTGAVTLGASDVGAPSTTGTGASGTWGIDITGTASGLSSTLGVSTGGTGATTLTGYVKGSGTSALTASSTIPGTDVSGDISGNAANVTGTVAVGNGGTGATTLTGYVKGNGTSAFTASSTIPGTDVSGDISGNAANVTGTVAVGNGGTGATTLALNNVLLGNGTSAVQTVAPGTNGNVLTSDGTTWVSAPASGGVSSVTASAPLASSGGSTPDISLTGTIGVANGGTGTSTAFTAGSVVFAGASGVYAQDNANLFWDDTNDRLGVGTSSPTADLHVAAGSIGTGLNAALVTGTLSTTGLQTGAVVDITGAGSSSGNQAFASFLRAGYTGTNVSRAIGGFNQSTANAGPSVLGGLQGNISVIGYTDGTNTGSNIGTWGEALNGSVNYGILGRTQTDKAGAVNVGGVFSSRNTTGTNVALYAGLLRTSNAEPSFTNSVMLFENGDINAPLMIGRAGNSNTTVWTMSASGAVTSQNSTNSGSAFQILTSTGSSLFVADTSQTRVAIGTSGATSRLTVNNGTEAVSLFDAQDNGVAVFTIGDGGDTTLVPSSGHTGDALSITGGTLASTKNALKATATLANPGSTFESGVSFQVTANGSANSLQFGILTQISGSYTGSGQTTALSFRNDLAGTGSLLFNDGLGMRPDGNRGAVGSTVSTTTGNNSAIIGTAGSGDRNFGGYFSANLDKASALNVGVYGAARNTAGSSTEIGGMFHLYSSTTFPTFASAALIADNGSSTSPIFLARDNGTTTFSIANDGVVLAKNTSDSVTAFQVQNAAGTTVLDVDTTNQRVGIGTTSPLYSVHSLTSSNTNNYIYVESTNSGNSASARIGVKSNSAEAQYAAYSSTFADLIGGISAADGVALTGGLGVPPSFMMFGTRTSAPGYWITNDVIRMTISASGDVGIGTATPANKVDIVAGTLATTQHALAVTGTMASSTNTENVIRFDVVSAGSSGAGNKSMLTAIFGAGYTGSAATVGSEWNNLVAGTGNNLKLDTSYSSPTGNSGFNAFAAATTTGLNVGGYSEASGGDVNVGQVGKAITAKNSATNVGAIGFGRNTGTSPTQVGGWFSLGNSTPTWTSAALVADNADQTSPIFLGRDNGTTVFTIADGSGVNSFGATEVALNDNSQNIDFRVESQNNANMLFVDASANAVSIGSSTSTPASTLSISGSVSKSITPTATSITLDGTHHTVLCSTSGGAVTITLPAAATCIGRVYVIKNTGTNAVTVQGTGVENIDGANTYSLPTQYQTLTVQSDGTSWWII